MRIGLIIEHFDASRGPAEKLAVWLAQELVRRGHEVHVVCHDVAVRVGRFRAATLRASYDAELSRRGHWPGGEPDNNAADGSLARGLHLHRLRGMRLHTGFGLRVFGVRAGRWFREHPVDVVHSFSVACPGDVYQASAGVYAAIQAQAAASRHTEAGGAWKRVLLRLPGKQRTLVALERAALEGRRAAGKVVATCRMTARELAAFFPAAVNRVVTLDSPQLAPTDATARTASWNEAEARGWFRGHYGIGERERVAVFVGHDFRREGLRYAIEAVAKTTSWRLLVVGQGRVREYVELARDLGVGMAEDEPGSIGVPPLAAGIEVPPMSAESATLPRRPRVMFLGPTGEMATVYAAADALISPTFYEPSGLVAIEALTAGLPIISTRHLGMCERVMSQRAGVIVDSPRDVGAMARALEELPAPGTAAWSQLRVHAREAGQGVPPTAYLEALERLYREVA